VSVRVAAIGDLHLRSEITPGLERNLQAVDGHADVLVLAGDITDGGRIPEVEMAASLLGDLSLPIVAVLGNHDRRGLRRREMRRLLTDAGVLLLDGDSVRVELANGRKIAFAGAGGYGGGFRPEEGPPPFATRFGQAVGVRARREALRLGGALDGLQHQAADATIVVMHYSPTISTLGAEPRLKHWMLGNSVLGDVVDQYPVDLVLHGHAHLGNLVGATPGGVPVRNVAAHIAGGPLIFDVGSPRQVRPVAFHRPFEGTLDQPSSAWSART
jgi:3',5'-cyclic AMP phosphodiesterase CpdA